MYFSGSVLSYWIRRLALRWLAVVVPLVLSACGSQVYHRVQQGETLYSVGFLYGQEYQQIAVWNELDPPYSLNPGQRLRVAPPSHVTERIRKRQGEPDVPDAAAPAPAAATEQVVVTAIPDEAPPRPLPQAVPVRPPAAAPAEPRTATATATAGRWLRPADGQLIKGYSADKLGAKGVDIGGRFGQPVRAAAGGKVVYSGDGLINYGNLIIIKHDERYLSAYGYNEKLRVKEGDNVVPGQHIADMGRAPDGTVMLHFEIRYNGKPVDPMRFIPGT